MANSVVYPAKAVAQTSSGKLTKRTYFATNFVEGDRTDVELFLDSSDTRVDFLEQTVPEIRLRINAQTFFAKADYPNSLKIEAYEYDVQGNKVFVSTIHRTLYNSKQAKNLQLKMNIGHFSTEYRQLYFDLFNKVGELVNSYSSIIEGSNISFQENDDTKQSLTAANCSSNDFDECQLEYILRNVNFEAIPSAVISTQVLKEADGTYTVTLPIAKRKMNVKRGTQITNKDTNAIQANGFVLGAFGGGSGSKITFGPDEDNLASWTYDASNDTVNLTFNGDLVTNGNVFTVTKDGKVGIGVDDPDAYLHIRAGDQGTPAVMLTAGTLTDTPMNGAIEYDGTSLYFTSAGVRNTVMLGNNLNYDVSGNISYSSLSSKVVIDDSVQVVSNKTLSNTMLINDIWIPTSASNGYVLTSTSDGHAQWLPATGVGGGNGGTTNASLMTSGTLSSQRGGTGVSNNGGTLTYGANDIVFNGDITIQTLSGSPVTINIPTTGSLATTQGTETLTNKTLTSPNVTTGTFDGISVFNGSIKMIDGNQANGYILSSDANGLATWVSAASLGLTSNGGSGNGGVATNIATANGNIFVGDNAGSSAGGVFNNTTLGYASADSITNGDENVAIGYEASKKITSGSYNVALGTNSLINGTTANGNIAVGYKAGDNITTGDRNITIGYDLDATSATADDQLNIGNAITGNLANGDVSIANDLTIMNDGIVSNDLSVVQDVTIGDDLSVTGDTDITGNIDVTGDATINGDTAITGTLAVTGQTSLQNSSVNGNAIFNDQGLATSDLRVEGDTQSNLLFIDASADNIGIATASPSDFRLQVAGDIGPNASGVYNLGSVTNKWATIYTQSLNADSLSIGLGDGAIGFGDANGNISQDTSNLYFDNANNMLGIGTSTPAAGLDIGGVSTTHAVTGANDLLVGGSTEIDANLFVDQNAFINGTLTTTGNSTLTGATTVGSTLSVTAATTLNSTLTTVGTSNLSGATTVGSTLGVTGATTLNSTLYVATTSTLSGATTLGSTVAITGAATLSNALDVAGASRLESLDVNGNAIFNDEGLASSDLRVEGDTQGNLLFVDASQDNVGIASSNPSSFRLQVAGDIGPETNNTYSLGSASKKFATIFTQSLNADSLALGFSAGAVGFGDANGNLVGDDNKFFYDNVNNFLGLGTNAPSAGLDIGGLTTAHAVSGNADLLVAGSAEINANMFVDGNAAIAGTGSITGATTLGSTLDVAGSTSLEALNVNGTAVFNNQELASVDLRVAGDTQGNLLFVDASLDNIGIATATPSSFRLQVAGDIGPETTNTYDLGSATKKFATIYTTALSADSLSLGLTEGSIGFADANGDLTEDTVNFYYDNTNNFLGLGTNAPSAGLDLGGVSSTHSLTGASDALIAGSIEIDTNLFVDGNTALNGATRLASTLTVNGATELEGATLVGGAMGLASTLTVNGATELEGAALVTGAMGLASTLAVNGATTLESTLAVTGTSTLSGATSVNNTLGVTGATTLSSSLDVAGASELESLGVNGGAVFNEQGLAGSDLRVETDTQPFAFFVDAGTDNVGIATGTPSSFRLQVAGNIGPDADVTYDLGSSTKKFATIFTQSLNADNLALGLAEGGISFADINGSLVDDAPNLFFDNTNNFLGLGTNAPSVGLDLGGASSTHSLSTANDALIAGSAEIDANLFVDGNSLLNGATAIIGATGLASTLTVNGATELEGAALVTGAMGLASTLTVNGATELEGATLIGGAMGLASTLTVNGATELEGAALVTGAMGLASTLTVNGATELEGATLVGGAMGLASTLTVNGTTELEGAALVTGAMGLASTLAVNGATTLESTLLVDGATTLNSSLSVNGNTIFNDQGLATNDLRIEGDTQGNLLFVDASLDNIGIATATPTDFRLQVAGNVGPDADSLYDLGSSSKRYATIYADAISTGTLALGLTDGSVTFADINGNLAEDISNFYYDNVNNFLGLGTNAPSVGLDLGGASTTHSLSTANDALIAGSVEIDANLFVDGNTALNGATLITGATGLASTLTVNGATELEGAALITGAMGLASTLTVNGATELEGAALVTGAMGLASTLTVNGATTLESTLVVDGATTLNSSLSINGNTIFNDQGLAANDLRVEGDTQGNLLFVDSSLDNIGIASANPADFRLQIAGDIGPETTTTYDLGSSTKKWATIYTQALNADTLVLGIPEGGIPFADANGSLTNDASNLYYNNANNFLGLGTNTPSAGFDIGGVTSTHSLTGNTDLLVAGSAEIDTNLFVDQDLAINGNAAITGNTAITGAALVTGAMGLASTLTVNGATELEGAALVTGAMGLASTLTVNGATELEGAALVTGAMGLASTLTVNGATELESTLLTTGAATFNSAISVNGNAIFNDQGLAANDLRVEGDTQGNLFFVDASLDNIGIAASNPTNFRLQVAGNIGPDANATYDLGSAGNKWANIYGETVNADILSLDYTVGSITFADANGNLTQDNAALYFDIANNFVGIGTNTPSAGLDIGGVTTGHALAGNSDVLVAGSVEIDTNLFVDSNAVIAGATAITGATGLASTLAVNGNTALEAAVAITGATGLASTLTVNGATELEGAVLIGGAMGLASTLVVNGATTLESTLLTTGAATFNSTISVNGNAIFNDQGLAANDLRVEGDTQANLFFVDASL
ncbi:MAG: hypothetical protein HOA17_00420, partial [Candidatus Melainabacteria bacterium]|nr:hypothetical protein [Candidatus Melainabacteria bacterium]